VDAGMFKLAQPNLDLQLQAWNVVFVDVIIAITVVGSAMQAFAVALLPVSVVLQEIGLTVGILAIMFPCGHVLWFLTVKNGWFLGPIQYLCWTIAVFLGWFACTGHWRWWAVNNIEDYWSASSLYFGAPVVIFGPGLLVPAIFMCITCIQLFISSVEAENAKAKAMAAAQGHEQDKNETQDKEDDSDDDESQDKKEDSDDDESKQKEAFLSEIHNLGIREKDLEKPTRNVLGRKGQGKSKSQGKREVLHDEPLLGTIIEWKGKFGWVKPNDTIMHPLASKHQGDLYLSQEDVEEEIEGVGSVVQFILYGDSRGLGASCVRPAQ